VKFFTASGKGGPVNELRKQCELPIVMVFLSSLIIKTGKTPA